MPMIDITSFKANGFAMIRGALCDFDFAPLEARFLGLAKERTGESYSAMNDPALVSRISGDHNLEMYLYEETRNHPELVELSQSKKLTSIAALLLGDEEVVLLEKIPFRIDCPMVLRELAVWHQDHFYVKGDVNIITAWIPMQETTFREGCLMVMPGSHVDGSIPHDVNVLEKKYYPSDIFTRDVRYIEMQRGDVLFFHSCLLHSSGNNISDIIRFSIQARFLPARCESDTIMGKRIKLS